MSGGLNLQDDEALGRIINASAEASRRRRLQQSRFEEVGFGDGAQRTGARASAPAPCREQHQAPASSGRTKALALIGGQHHSLSWVRRANDKSNFAIDATTHLRWEISWRV